MGPTVTASALSSVFWRDTSVRFPMTNVIITIMIHSHCVSVPMPAPTTCSAPVQSCSLSTQCQLVSSSINSVSSWLPLPSDKSHLVKWFFRKNGFFAVCADSVVQSLDQSTQQTSEVSWIFLSTSFSLPCINPQALMQNVSWNQWKILSDLSLDQPNFLVIACLKQQTVCSLCLWNRKWWPEMLRPLLSFKACLLPVAC